MRKVIAIPTEKEYCLSGAMYFFLDSVKDCCNYFLEIGNDDHDDVLKKCFLEIEINYENDMTLNYEQDRVDDLFSHDKQNPRYYFQGGTLADLYRRQYGLERVSEDSNEYLSSCYNGSLNRSIEFYV